MTIQEANMDIHSQSKQLQDLKFRKQSMGKLIEENKQLCWGENRFTGKFCWTDGCCWFPPFWCCSPSFLDLARCPPDLLSCLATENQYIGVTGKGSVEEMEL